MDITLKQKRINFAISLIAGVLVLLEFWTIFWLYQPYSIYFSPFLVLFSGGLLYVFQYFLKEKLAYFAFLHLFFFHSFFLALLFFVIQLRSSSVVFDWQKILSTYKGLSFFIVIGLFALLVMSKGVLQKDLPKEEKAPFIAKMLISLNVLFSFLFFPVLVLLLFVQFDGVY